MQYAIVFVVTNVIFWSFTFVVVRCGWSYGYNQGREEAQRKWERTQEIKAQTNWS